GPRVARELRRRRVLIGRSCLGHALHSGLRPTLLAPAPAAAPRLRDMAIDTEDAPCSPTCLFCGKTDGPFDVEDVFPKWTRRVLPVPMQTTQVRTTPDGVPVPSSAPTSTYLNAKLKDSVCRDCN